MNVFECASEDEIKKLILSSSSKSCDLDPIPTGVLKNCLDILITPITDIINISMETSNCPQNFKEAYVRPPLYTALLKVYNYIIISMNKGEVKALTLLDLSAAFDTIDHATLTDRLSDWYGISSQAQILFSSYLQNRHLSVKNKDTLSDRVTL